MPEIQTDVEDDDDAFGDFKFISSPSLPHHANPIPAEDDEWGDFVENPLQFHFQTPPNPHPFGLFSGLQIPITDPPPTTPYQSHLGGPQLSADLAVEKRWEKPRGALPLSIFGEEEEEESNTVDLSFDARDEFPLKCDPGTKNGAGSGPGVGLNDLILNLYGRDEQIKTENGALGNSDLVDESADFDENCWEFKEANSEFEGEDGSLMEEQKDSEVLGVEAKATRTVQEIEDLISSSLKVGIRNGVRNENGLHTNSVNRNVSSFENFWVHNDEFSEAGVVDFFSEQKKEQKVSDLLGAEAKVCTSTTEIQGIEEMLEHSQGTTLSYTFSNGKPDYGEMFDAQGGFFHGLTTSVSNGFNGVNSGWSSAVSDLISDLYSQAEQISTVNSTRQPTANEFSSTQLGLNSDLVNGDDDLDENDWEFKDAFSEGTVGNGDPGFETVDAHQNFSAELKLKNFVGFYSRLKDEARFFILDHLDDLKKAKKDAALSGDEIKVMAFDEEIQAAYEKVRVDNSFSGKVHPEEHPPRNICVLELLEVVQDPSLRGLETEYHLSKRISLAERDLSSAVGLLEHAMSVLQILTLASEEEQATYISAWLKMVSACAQELQRGSMIWKQSLQKNFHVQVLSKAQGLNYFLALGEIYRVSLVLRASVALYKPWILLKSRDSTDIFAFFEDCKTSWIDSGLKESLKRISDSADLEYAGTIKALLESIKYTHDLDEVSLYHHAFDQGEPICRLSLLPSGLIQDMKVVLWNGEHYFLKLANLWGNRVSCDPPRLPHIHVY
ncbi:uncharacterized protein LOC131230387 isoform X3 [Magnolia sinica]|uniref:uncharacterized protein LOC131230387 isoform X3 n=1 Tax=Magnolia sinica TaxID=86752 RepID=UPI00265ADC78|nr:uncharacterized protein LOC131230387 isoform X3 [Magnolia sinica]